MSAVLDKIRSETPKKHVRLARARRVNGHNGALLTEKAQQILSRFLPAAAQAWVDGLKAQKIVWNSDLKDYQLTDYADHKVRSECAEKIWHNVVGRPIERSLQVTGNYKDLSQVLDELKSSPEARRLLPPEIWGMVPRSPAPSVEEKPVDQNPENEIGGGNEKEK